jgi:hypothetical protein
MSHLTGFVELAYVQSKYKVLKIMNEEINPLKKIARLAGLFWLLNVLTTAFSLGYVRSNLIVLGDAALTANNILTNESMFRMGIASYLFSQIFLFFIKHGRPLF